MGWTAWVCYGLHLSAMACMRRTYFIEESHLDLQATRLSPECIGRVETWVVVNPSLSLLIRHPLSAYITWKGFYRVPHSISSQQEQRLRGRVMAGSLN